MVTGRRVQSHISEYGPEETCKQMCSLSSSVVNLQLQLESGELAWHDNTPTRDLKSIAPLFTTTGDIVPSPG